MSFDEHCVETPKEKVSDYTLNGKAVTLTKKRGRPPKIRNPLFTPAEKKIEVAALYCVTGDITQVATLAKVTEKQIRAWMQEPFWDETQRQISREANEKLLGKSTPY